LREFFGNVAFASIRLIGFKAAPQGRAADAQKSRCLGAIATKLCKHALKLWRRRLRLVESW
jgi:hypothetical protein